MTKRVATFGMLVALAFIFSYIETLIPIPLGIPGVKLGLANVVVFAALYLMSPRDALAVSLVRMLLVSFTFGNLSTLMYSLAGGLLSFFMMWLCKHFSVFGKVGVSIIGGICHNVGQIGVAALILGPSMFAYLPWLLIAGSAAGAGVGLLGGYILERIQKTVGRL